MGCSMEARGATAAARTSLAMTPAPVGPKFPDVSAWQGHPNWAAAKPMIEGAIVKAGEAYFQDPDYVWNVHTLNSLRLPWIPYWFVRPSVNCLTEANDFVQAIRAVGGTPVRRAVLDIEVPGLSGYAACMDNVIDSSLGFHAIIYSSPGTWPGGSTAGLNLWVAAYGASAPPCLAGVCNVAVAGRQSILAWQYTDGAYGPVTYIPGIGNIDVSLDYGHIFSSPPTATISSARGYAAVYNLGFNTGYDARLGRHYVPADPVQTSLSGAAWNAAYNAGFNAGWKAA